MSKVKVPSSEGDIVYYVTGKGIVCLVALRRVDTDTLDWFEVGAQPYFSDRIGAAKSEPGGESR